MSHYRSLGWLAILLLFIVGCTPAPAATPVPCPAPPPAAGAPKVLLIAREHSLSMERTLSSEVGVMECQLQAAGLNVEVASATGKPIVGGAITLVPDVKLSDVNMVDYAGIILPCMAVGVAFDSVSIPPAVCRDRAAGSDAGQARCRSRQRGAHSVRSGCIGRKAICHRSGQKGSYCHRHL